MWTLDPANSPDLFDQLRPHWRTRDFEVACGEGWRPLVQECHDRLVAIFSDYELLAIKQKYGALEFQAFPRQWVKGQRLWSAREHHELDVITDDIRLRSESVCEWCGRPGRLREWRTMVLTLCDGCDSRFPDAPTPRPWMLESREKEST